MDAPLRPALGEVVGFGLADLGGKKMEDPVGGLHAGGIHDFTGKPYAIGVCG